MTASDVASDLSPPRPAPSGPLARLRRYAAANRQRAVYALNVSLIAALALACSFVLDLDRSYWALLTVALVSQATSSLTVWRSIARTIGTLVGAGFALAILALFAQNSAAMIASLALWIFCISTLARFEVGLDAYAYSVAGLTALVVAFDTGADAGTAYDIALQRTTETLIGIGAAFAIILVVFPQSGSRVLIGGIADARNKIFDLARKAAAVGEEIDVRETQSVTKALSATYANLRAQKLERSHLRVSTRKATEATNRLNRLLIAAEQMSYALAGLGEGKTPPQVVEIGDKLRALLADLPPSDAGLEAGAIDERAKAFRDVVAAVDVDPGIRDLAQRPDRPTSRELMALSAMRRFAVAAATFLDAEAAMLDPARPKPRPRPIAARYPDWPSALERGARPCILFLGLSILWLASASSSFQTLALIATGLCVTLPAIAPRQALTSGGIALAQGFAAMLLPVLALEATLPYVETFPAFALLLGSVFFVFFYICYAPLLRTYSLGGAIFLATALQPSNVEQYDALGAFNAIVSLALLPFAIGSAFTVIMPEDQPWLRRHLTRAGTVLLNRAIRGRDDHADEFLAQSLDAIGDYGGDLDLKDRINRRNVRRSRMATAAGLEFYELHRLRRLGHLPESLAARLPEIGAAIRREATRDDAAARDVLEAARREAFDAASADGLPELTRSGALRFAIGAEFLEVLVEDGRLRLAR